MDQTVRPATPIARVVLASFIGTSIEWYDFFLYGTAAALVFNKLFFPTLDPLAGTMAAFATYAVGFFARPLGGGVFGHYGDRVGRKSMLVTTLLMMGLSTFLIGALPTYDQAGVAAPVALAVLRFVQGLGVGGEWGGAVLLVVEHGHHGRRGFYASSAQMGVPAGLLLANGAFGAVSVLPEAQLLSWGWRVPFLAGAVLLGLGLFIRLHILETPLFAQALAQRATSPRPLLDLVRNYPKNLLLAMGARFAENSCFYVFTVFIYTYASESRGFARDTILVGVLLASALQLVAIPGFAALSDRLGRRPVYLAGALFVGLFAFPFFWLVDSRVPVLIWLALALGLAGTAAMYGPQAAFFSELFGTQVRYSGASLGSQLAAPFAGGLAPLIATALLGWSGGRPWPIALYMIGMVLITFCSVFLAAETVRADLSRR
jgi:MFS transporter, MHS family, shikimate and dehydroshikimate transport protein